jgi:histidyl-tRNA synthetase
LGGAEVPAIGFAMGVERLLLLMETYNLLQASEKLPDIYLILMGERAELFGLKLSEQLRDSLPHVKVMMNLGQASIKNQFKRADKSGAKIAVIIGEDEINSGVVTIKHLREDLPQKVVNFNDLGAALLSVISA